MHIHKSVIRYLSNCLGHQDTWEQRKKVSKEGRKQRKGEMGGVVELFFFLCFPSGLIYLFIY